MRKKYKILISAYSTNPFRGSEPATGWKWPIGISKINRFNVSVITQKKNKISINKFLQNKNTKINFIYYDLPYYFRFLKKKWFLAEHKFSYFYYTFWQFGAFLHAKKINSLHKFDIIHQITIGGVRLPSFMGLINSHFILGPLGGGENIKLALRKQFGIKGFLKSIIRDLSNLYVKIDPLMLMTFFTAKSIYARTRETKNLIPKIFHGKTKILNEVPLLNNNKINYKKNFNKFKILFVGRLIYWKGVDLVLETFKKIYLSNKNISLTIIGDGSEKKRFLKISNALGISNKIKWVNKINYKKMNEMYQQHDLFFFPSYHDAGGYVIHEASYNQLPVAALDTAAANYLLHKNKKYQLVSILQSRSEIINKFCYNINLLIKNKKLRYGIGLQNKKNLNDHLLSKKIKTVYNF